MRFFERLDPEDLEILGRRGKHYRLSLLPVRLLGSYLRLLETVKSDPSPSVLARGRATLRRFLLDHVPALKRELPYLDFYGTNRLVCTLFFGMDDADAERSSSVRESTDDKIESFDYEYDMPLITARILHLFPGYTRMSLLNESAPVFFELARLAERIQADESLASSRGVAIGLGSPRLRKHLLQVRGPVVQRKNRRNSGLDYTEEELAAAIRRNEETLRKQNAREE